MASHPGYLCAVAGDFLQLPLPGMDSGVKVAAEASPEQLKVCARRITKFFPLTNAIQAFKSQEKTSYS